MYNDFCEAQMRKIKFKAIEYGEFVYGLPYYTEDGAIGFVTREGFDCKVDLDTISQFTGLKDKNGVDIYEGDLLGDRCLATSGSYQVNWCGESGAYKIGDTGYQLSQGNLEYCNFEVIGNIHEK